VFVVDCSNTLTIPKSSEPQKQLQSRLTPWGKFNQGLQRKRYTKEFRNSKIEEHRPIRKQPQVHKSDLSDQKICQFLQSLYLMIGVCIILRVSWRDICGDFLAVLGRLSGADLFAKVAPRDESMMHPPDR